MPQLKVTALKITAGIHINNNTLAHSCLVNCLPVVFLLLISDSGSRNFPKPDRALMPSVKRFYGSLGFQEVLCNAAGVNGEKMVLGFCPEILFMIAELPPPPG